MPAGKDNTISPVILTMHLAYQNTQEERERRPRVNKLWIRTGAKGKVCVTMQYTKRHKDLAIPLLTPKAFLIYPI
jgi:hypothetical protein